MAASAIVSGKIRLAGAPCENSSPKITFPKFVQVAPRRVNKNTTPQGASIPFHRRQQQCMGHGIERSSGVFYRDWL
jgi:hypothetical protein